MFSETQPISVGDQYLQNQLPGERASTAKTFTARPRMLNRPGPLAQGQQFEQKYRDPYREFIKIVPQNIMHDRRIVRGNTFAALVIPISKHSCFSTNSF